MTLAALVVHRLAVEQSSQLSLQIGTRIEDIRGGAQTRGPYGEGQLTPVRLIDLLPGLKLWHLGIQDQTVEIENHRSDHAVSHAASGPEGATRCNRLQTAHSAHIRCQ